MHPKYKILPRLCPSQIPIAYRAMFYKIFVAFLFAASLAIVSGLCQTHIPTDMSRLRAHTSQMSSGLLHRAITRSQWTNINKLLIHGPVLSSNARISLDNNIYKKYKIWATNYAIKYIKKHKAVWRRIKETETTQKIAFVRADAEDGLLEAIKNYRPTAIHTNFDIYAASYIRNAIRNGIRCKNK